MKPVSVSQFRKNPSAYLAKAKAGLSFLLVSRGKVVARVEPFEASDDWHLHLADLVARGIVKKPKKARRR